MSSSSDRVKLICGPPCAGKNTYIDRHKSIGDAVIDYDAIMQKLSGLPSHVHDAAAKGRAHIERDNQIRWLLESGQRGWVISSSPLIKDRYKYPGVLVLVLDPSEPIALERASRERPAIWTDFVHDWYRRFEPDSRDLIVDTSGDSE